MVDGLVPRLAFPRHYRVATRIIDVVVAGAVLLLTMPLTAAIAIWVWFGDRGPVLYRGSRVGRYGRPFAMLKFRTMVANADRLGGPSTPADDPRLTSAGRFLRGWKLDELPQFLNVLRGEMSLVGPRPQVAGDVARYTPDELRLLSVRPGITDWASVRFRDEGEILAGHADPDRAYDELIRPAKIDLGLRYVARRGLRTDCAILWLTARVLLQPSRATDLVARSVPQPVVVPPVVPRPVDAEPAPRHTVAGEASA